MQIITASPLFGLFVTFVTYGIGTLLFKKFKTPLLNPLLFSFVCCIALIKLGVISYEKYMTDTKILADFIPVATALLAVNIYRQRKTIKKYGLAIAAGCFAGAVTSIVLVAAVCALFGADSTLLASFIGKSCTNPIAVEICRLNGGLAGVTVIAVLITGVEGAVLAPLLGRIFKVTSPVAEGVAIGSCSHVIGTTKAVEIGEVQGALSSVAIGICGLITVVLLAIFY